MRVSAVPRLTASLIGLPLVVLAFLWAGSIWTKAIDERGAVFTHKGKSYRSGISYNLGGSGIR